jgi:hypothetical protein
MPLALPLVLHFLPSALFCGLPFTPFPVGTVTFSLGFDKHFGLEQIHVLLRRETDSPLNKGRAIAIFINLLQAWSGQSIKPFLLGGA